MSKLRFAVDYYKVMHEDPYQMILEAYVVSEGGNKHETWFTLESMEKSMPFWANKAIVCMWDKYLDDFKEHARDKYQEEKQIFVGNIPETNMAEIVEYKDKKFLKMNIIIWKAYHPKIAERLASEDYTDISMEIEPTVTSEREDGSQQIDEFLPLGICLLGENYSPAIEDATSKVVKYSTNEGFDEDVKKFNKFYSIAVSEYDIPKDVKEIVSESLGLEQTNSNILKFSKKIINSDKLTYGEITDLFGRINNSRKKENLVFYGGDVAREWCKDIIIKFESTENVEEDVGKDDTSVDIDDSKDTDIEPVPTEEDPKKEIEKYEVGQFVKLENDGETITGEISEVVIDGKINYSDSEVEGTVNDPAVKINIYKKEDDGWVRTEMYSLCEMSKIEKVEDLKQPSKYGKELYSLKLVDMFNLLAKMVEEKEMDEYGYPMYALDDVDMDKGMMYVATMGYPMKYYAMKYMPMENMEGMYNVMWEDMMEVYPMKEYVMLENMKEDMMADKDMMGAMDKMYSLMAEKGKELKTVKEKYSDVDSTIEKKDDEIKSLKTFKFSAIKEKVEEKAEALYQKYSEFIDEEKKKEFNAKLEDIDVDSFEDKFAKDVYAYVLPLVEAKAESNTSDKKDDDSLKMNYSQLLGNVGADNKLKGSLAEQLKRL